MNTWNTLPDSYHQRGYKITLATLKCQIQQAENPTPDVVICVEVEHVVNATLLDYLTSEVAHVENATHLDYLNSEVVLEEIEIRITDRNIPIDKNSTDAEQHLAMRGGSRGFEDEGDERDELDAIPTTCLRRWHAAELERCDLRTRDVDGCEGKDGANVDADADEEGETSQADDGST